MKFPLVLCSLMFIIGAWFGVIMPTFFVVFLVVVVFFMFVWRYFRFVKSNKHQSRTPIIYVSLLTLLLIAGILRGHFVEKYNLSEVHPFVDQEVQLCGEVVGIDQSDTGTFLDVKAFWIEKNNERKQVNAKIRVNLYMNYDDFKIRDVITASGKLDILPQMQFWGDISKRSVFGAKGIFAVVNVARNDVKIVGHNDMIIDILNFGYMSRNAISGVIDKKLPNLEGALLKGILVGDKSDFTEEMSNNLKLSGLSHIAAVSGVNISIFLMFIAYLINYIGIKRKVNAIIMFGATILFMIVIGDQPTVLRAGVMMLFTIFMLNLKLRNDMTSSLFFATFVLVAFNPYLAHDIGFQLSFFAVLGLILYVDKIGKNVFLAGVSVFVIITPIIAYYFNIVTFASLFTTILIEPLFIIILPLGYIVWLIPSIATLLYPLLKVILFISDFFASIEFLTLPVPSPSISVLVICAVLLYILYEWLKNKVSFRSNRFFIAYLIIIAVLTNLSYNIIANRGMVEVNFISVGQADSIHIKTSKGLNILIDSGLAQSKVRTYLNKRGIDKLDLIFITNFSAEHIGGTSDLIENFQVDSLMLPNIKNGNKDYEDSLKKNNTRISYYDNIGDIKIDESNTIKILMFITGNKKDVSSVIQLKCNNTQIMVPSNIDCNIENELITNYKNNELESDILLVGNHGLDSATSEKFIKAVKPKYPIISSGKIPSDAILQRLNNFAQKPIRTDLFGTVSVKIGEYGINRIDTTRCGEESY